mgnify:CR=1 FL=1
MKKNNFLGLSICLIIGSLFSLWIVYASDAFLSDEDFARKHPETVKNGQWELYENPEEVKTWEF